MVDKVLNEKTRKRWMLMWEVIVPRLLFLFGTADTSPGCISVNGGAEEKVQA